MGAWPQEDAEIEGKKPDLADLPDFVSAAVNAIVGKKGEEIVIFDMRGFTPFVDFNLLADAGSPIQAKVLMDAVIGAAKENGLKLKGVEGDPESGWVLVDFWDLVVHIFRPELRRYYNLEGLWGDLPSIVVRSPEVG